jgi:hypothetical protein
MVETGIKKWEVIVRRGWGISGETGVSRGENGGK